MPASRRRRRGRTGAYSNGNLSVKEQLANALVERGEDPATPPILVALWNSKNWQDPDLERLALEVLEAEDE